MRPCVRPRHPGDQRPVDLARRARAEGLCERRGGKTRFGHQQAAGRILVEPVHEPRPLRVGMRPAQRAEHAVDVAHGTRAALHGEAHRLVEDEHVVVFVQRDRFDKGAVLLRLRGVIARRRRRQRERRHTHALPGFEPRLRLGALAVQAHLAFAHDALDVAERQARKPRLEEAVDAHAGFIRRHGERLDAFGLRHPTRRLNCAFRAVILGGRRSRPSKADGAAATRSSVSLGKRRPPSPFEARSRAPQGDGSRTARRVRLLRNGCHFAKALAPTEAALAFVRASRPAALMAWSCLLSSAAGLARAAASPAHYPLRSLRSFAQYSNRFLISRSKPRSGGS